MKATLDCLPCLFRQAVDAVRRVADDPNVHELVVRELALSLLSGLRQRLAGAADPMALPVGTQALVWSCA
jgi:uncharacterized protein with ATP-grasp and redox domains